VASSMKRNAWCGKRAFMPSILRNTGCVILAAAVAAGYSLAQEAFKERHLRDIEAEQPISAILASPLCKQTRESGQLVVRHTHDIDPSNLEPDLSSLMEQRDELVLASEAIRDATVISPSGEDAVHYFDVEVMRTWNGSHKVGDVLTFAIPMGGIRCQPMPNGDSKANFATVDKTNDWKGQLPGPYGLFLRQTQGAEAQQTTGLRLTGGDGVQGLVGLNPVTQPRDLDKYCNGYFPERVVKCNAFLNASEAPVETLYRQDPLVKKYDGMPISSFLKEVQSAADSVGYASQPDSPK
jgi:hypothetical protein